MQKHMDMVRPLASKLMKEDCEDKNEQGKQSKQLFRWPNVLEMLFHTGMTPSKSKQLCCLVMHIYVFSPVIHKGVCAFSFQT